MTANVPNITGLILAGGQGSRMGGVDKGLQPFRGKPMVAHVVERLGPQVATIIINANRSLEEYKAHSNLIVQDSLTGFQGPLAGFYAGMEATQTPLMLTVPCDSPFLPLDLAQRMVTTMLAANALVAIAKTGQPVFCLLHICLKNSLADFLSSGQRKIDIWTAQHPCVEVPFDDVHDAFENINTPDDIQRLS
jgi:molybdenum cofactor guanylyltransferase